MHDGFNDWGSVSCMVMSCGLLRSVGAVLLDSLHMFSLDVCGLVGSYLLAGRASSNGAAAMIYIWLDELHFLSKSEQKCLSLAIDPVCGDVWIGSAVAMFV